MSDVEKSPGQAPAHPGASTESGLPFEPVYGPEALTGSTRTSGWASRATIRSPAGVYPTMYTGRPWTMRQYAGFGTATESNARYQQLIAARHRRPLRRLRPAHPDGPRLRRADRARRGRQGRRRDRLDRGHAGAVRRHPAGQGVHVDDDQRPGGAAAAALPAGRRGARRPRPSSSPAPSRTTCSRSTSPAARTSTRRAVAAADHRHLRVLQGRDPALEHHLHLRLPHGRGRCLARAGDRLHAGRRHRVRPRGAGRRASTSTTSPPRLSFFFVARTTLLEEVAKFRAARRIWARVMRDEFGAKNPKSLMLRFHTQTAGVQLTAQQPEVNLVRVAMQGLAAVLGGTQSPAHQLLRRGDRAADREGGPAGAAHPAGARLRDRRDQDRRPVRRLLRRRGDHRRRRGRGRELMAQVEELGGAVAAIEEGFQKNEIEKVGVRDRPARSTRASGSSSASTGSARRGGARTSRCASTRRSRSSRPSGWPRCAPSATRPPSTAPGGADGGGRGRPTTCCTR